MKQFKTVFGFELKNMFRSKAIIITTIIISLFALVMTTIPSFLVWFDSDEDLSESSEEVSDIEDESDELVVIYDNQELEEVFVKEFGASKYDSEEGLKAAVENEEIESGFIIHDYNDYTYITYDSSTFATEQMEFESTLSHISEEVLFEKEGINSDKVYEIIDKPINVETITLGKDAGSGMTIAFLFILVLYMLILLYGTNVATSVAREKDSRTMELLITSTKPRTLILGKVAATGLMGILQVFAVLFSAGIGFLLNKVNYPGPILELIKGTMTIDTIIVYVLFSVLGYILYLFIYASLGSLVSKVEDVNSAVAPITLLFLLAYFVAMIGMQFPDSAIIKVTSFIPFISMFTMPIRYMLTSVPLISIIASSLIMIITVVLLAKLSIYIYRLGSLQYGNRIKLKDIVKSFSK